MTGPPSLRTRGRPPRVHPGFQRIRDAMRAGVISLTEKGVSPWTHRRPGRAATTGGAAGVRNPRQDMGASPETLRAQLIEVLEDRQAQTRRCLRAAQIAGALPRAKLECHGGPLETIAVRGFALAVP